jgi:hypothetical protein
VGIHHHIQFGESNFLTENARRDNLAGFAGVCMSLMLSIRSNNAFALFGLYSFPQSV